MSIKELIPRVKLTPEQTKLWETTCTAFMWHCPSFAHIFYKMLDKVGSEYHAVFTDLPLIPVAATDGGCVIFNVNTYFKYPLPQRVFIFVHEIMHCVLNHAIMNRGFQKVGFILYDDGSKLSYDHSIMNKAEDYVINDILVQAQHGKLPPGGLWDTNIGTALEAAIDVYRKIYRQEKRNSSVGGFDIVLEPGSGDGKDEVTATAERSQAEWDVAIQTAAQIGKLRGDFPGILGRVFGEVLQPKVDWREHIETLLARSIGGEGSSWRKPDRRLIVRDIYAPGRSGHAAGTIVVASDTSGSIGNKELDMFFAELAGLLEDLNPRRLIILWCDAAVHQVDECEDSGDLNTIRFKGVEGGGGGTDFKPVFKWLNDEGIEPDTLVYLTDGYGDWPKHQPTYPVVWGSIGLAPEGFPFGEVVMVPCQA